MILMLNATKLISSHIDVPVHKPKSILRFGSPKWNFIFLQHGVIKHDLSKWLNPKQLAMFVTSTQAEYDSIAGDYSRYRFSSREVALTGLPRFDALFQNRQSLQRGEKNVVLITPTWRRWLTAPTRAMEQKRSISTEFLDSDFYKEWASFLSSPVLESLIHSNDLRLIFLPHPNLEAALPLFDLPRFVEIHRYSDADVHRLFAKTVALVTDYSSTAFDAAYIKTPVVYFQFDKERMESGEHTFDTGYFCYERDGFGPITQTHIAAVQAVEAIVCNRGEAVSPYDTRIEAAFPQRDGKCCERVTSCIEGI
jgi:CDP-glycerol glycerophosphotransferase (TagB/SpsB family)